MKIGLLRFIRLRPLIKAIERNAIANERIATTLETIAREGYGIRLTPVTPAEMAADDAPELAYATDEATAASEAHDELVRLGYRAPSVEE